jgi:3D (Asp-Asp-Asp) domain-containing protein
MALTLGVLGAGVNSVAAAGVAAAEFEPTALPVIARLRNTYYYLVPEVDYEQSLPQDVPVQGMDGQVLALVSRAFKRDMDMEGTGRLRDGRVVNFAGVIDHQIRYAETIHPWGRGVGNCPLVPYHTIAVDRNLVALGTVVYIDETDGKLLPDGTRHNGIWRAEDVGGAIQKNRVDLFMGEGIRSGELLGQWGIGHLQPLTVRLVSKPAETNCTQDTPQ